MENEKILERLKKMRSLVSPEKNTYGISSLENAKMPGKLTNVLRVFQPIHVEKGRKANTVYGFDFDKYNDALSDSPITIAAKLNKNWEEYNYHIIIQSGVCNFRCHYCYVDYRFLTGKEMLNMTAQEIINEFLCEREKAKEKGLFFNVFRISGGEPMLIPDLTLFCLREIKRLNLDKEVCIKTETNLSPLAKIDNKPLAAYWVDLKELSQYNNFIVHPTLHGISSVNIQKNARVSQEMFDIVCDGVHSLIEYGIDFFPSFGANTVEIKDVEPFFERMKTIHKNLPLRFAVRPFKFNYNAVTARQQEKYLLEVSKQNEIIDKWDDLLQKEYKVKYAEVPRHKVMLST